MDLPYVQTLKKLIVILSCLSHIFRFPHLYLINICLNHCCQIRKLQSTKTRDNQSTLLHYIAGLVEKSCPEVFDIVIELGSATTEASKGMLSLFHVVRLSSRFRIIIFTYSML